MEMTSEALKIFTPLSPLPIINISSRADVIRGGSPAPHTALSVSQRSVLRCDDLIWSDDGSSRLAFIQDGAWRRYKSLGEACTLTHLRM